jgi:hypothetical protein
MFCIVGHRCIISYSSLSTFLIRIPVFIIPVVFLFQLTLQTVTVMLDHCLDTGSDPFASTSQTTSSLPLESTQCRGSLPLTYNEGPIGWGAPLLLGGRYEDHKSSHERKSLDSENDFHGCLSHVRVNKEFQDLGSPGAMTASVAGCGALSCFRPSKARYASCSLNQAKLAY